mmetsp:Transcript_17069/g.46137  ORF Transcript_17069/g.46137 Transcript_17069/m.46137 type:complete len:278 (+) Transcript_17069:41-874(+)
MISSSSSESDITVRSSFYIDACHPSGLASVLVAQTLLSLTLGLGLAKAVADDELPHTHLRESLARHLQLLFPIIAHALALIRTLDHVVNKLLHGLDHLGLHLVRDGAHLAFGQAVQVARDGVALLCPRVCLLLDLCELAAHARYTLLELGDVGRGIHLHGTPILQLDRHRPGNGRRRGILWGLVEGASDWRGRQAVLTEAKHLLELLPAHLGILVCVKDSKELAHVPVLHASRRHNRAVDAHRAALELGEEFSHLSHVQEARAVGVRLLKGCAQVCL